MANNETYEYEYYYYEYEYESEREIHPFDETAMLYTSGAYVLTLFSISWALITVYKHEKLVPIVKFYLFCEHGLRLLGETISYLWGSACIMWYADVSLPWLNCFLGFFAQTLSIAVSMAQLALGVNRFFAISFNGRYYGRLYSGKWTTQAIVFTLLSVLPASVTLIPGNYILYDTEVYKFTSEGGEYAVYYMLVMHGAFPLFVFSSTMIMDIIMLSKLHGQRMIINHLANLIVIVISVVYAAVYIEDLFYVFILGLIVINVPPGIYGLNVVIFLGGRTKSRANSVKPST